MERSRWLGAGVSMRREKARGNAEQSGKTEDQWEKAEAHVAHFNDLFLRMRVLEAALLPCLRFSLQDSVNDGSQRPTANSPIAGRDR